MSKKIRTEAVDHLFEAILCLKDKSSYLKRYREHENLKKINPAKSFTPDGIIDEEAWNNGEKILFILKEANGQWMLDENLEDNTVEIDNGEFWFRKIVKDNINHNIKRKLNKLSAELFPLAYLHKLYFFHNKYILFRVKVN